MPLMRIAFICALVISVVTSIGCSGGRPKGFPDVRPCSVTVTDGAAPLAGVDVNLVPTPPISSAVMFGTTDANGKAVITTVFAGHAEKGAPEGNYAVVLKKNIPIPHTKSEEERSKMNYDQTMKYSAAMSRARAKLPQIVPVSLTRNDSPLKLSVDSTGGTLDVDVARHR